MQMIDEVKVTWHEHSVSQGERERLNGNQGCVVWFTGLSGSGKSTIVNLVDHKLNELGVHTFVLDGDNIRHGLSASPQMLVDQHGEGFANRFGLGFSAQDREENIRRVGNVAQLFRSAGIVTLIAIVSPYRHDRDSVRTRVESTGESGDFIEVFVDTAMEVCEQRDPKGLYKKSRAGELIGMTGIDDPYEPPLIPELALQAGIKTAQSLANEVVSYLRSIKKIN